MLELAHEKLYWPKPSQIWEPSGSGPKVYAQLASEKIGEKIKREFREEASGLTVSVLAANPEGDETEAPIAIVCQFTRPVPPAVIKEVHRLAWSFSRARSLITIEPQLLRVWSCCEPPQEKEEPKTVFEVTETDLDHQAADALQWVELVSGQFFQERENRFKRSGAADQMLLKNLKDVRQQLKNDGLYDETIHNLLARIIFIQFLFQKQDSKGTPALNEEILQNLHRQKILSKEYKNLPEILENFDDTYNLFRWLNNKFNGDLFPGKGKTDPEREADWQAEIKKVRTEDNRYLVKLAQFARGDLDMQSSQLSLWPYYSFDVIPLDFISSIYEEFVNKKAGKGVHYTPEYLVDFILDGVLPWNEEEWDLKILDPACGSGIFLVKAFQRLIYRWELAHDFQRIPANVLRTLLENNIFGVDIDKEAVRVASFSLYLTMLDSIDPLEYWENEVSFPILREQRLIRSDFFAEDKEGFRTTEDAATYDLVLGNAPWGNNSVKLSDYALAWQNRSDNQGKWKVSYGNIGLLFLPKAAALTKAGGTIVMMQPAMPILFNQSGPAKKFREQLFSNFKVEEIVNLSVLRFGLFKDAISPTCIITLRNTQPNDEPLTYICPKSEFTNEDNYRLIIEPQDVNFIYSYEALSLSYIWSALMWGGRRDLYLVQHLSCTNTLEKYKESGVILKREGIKRGDRQKIEKQILDRKILNNPNFPEGTFLWLNSENLPINNDPELDGRASTNFSAFEYPQLILKQSWRKESGRFQAALIRSNNHKGILCSESYITVHTGDIHLLEVACLSYNSKLATYHLLLSSGRFSSYRPEPNGEDLLRVPIPEYREEITENLETFDDVDHKIYDAFSLKESEKILIEDTFNYTLPDFKGDSASPGRQKTHRKATNLFKNQEEPELTQYCEYFMRVIRAGFGQDKQICATIFQESTSDYLPVRLVAIYLNKSIHDRIKVETINSQTLLDRLNQLNKLFMEQDNTDTGGIFYQRVARVYASTELNGEQIPTVYLIKPDKIRYWTRSMALRDADEVSSDIMLGRTELIKKSEAVSQ
jgi:type I restriction-modification system DNA methylase subunit